MINSNQIHIKSQVSNQVLPSGSYWRRQYW